MYVLVLILSAYSSFAAEYRPRHLFFIYLFIFTFKGIKKDSRALQVPGISIYLYKLILVSTQNSFN